MTELGPVGIVGAGSIGVGWTIVFARAGHEVSLYDVSRDRLGEAETEIEERLVALADHGLLGEDSERVASRTTLTGDLPAAVASATHVQECVPERRDLKRDLLSRAIAAAPAEAVVASSTSAMLPSDLFGGLGSQERCLVAHPVNPPYLIPIVELVASPRTAPHVLDAAEARFRGAGMSPIRIHREVEGFVVNRLQGALLREAYWLLRDGVATARDIDRAVHDGLGRRWSLVGPFETADLNTRGGLARHAEVMWPAYARMGGERGTRDPMSPALLAQAVAERRAQLPLREWEDRVAWRDRALMAQQAALRRQETGAWKSLQEPERCARMRARRDELFG